MSEPKKHEKKRGSGRGKHPNSLANLTPWSQPGPGRKPLTEVERAAREASGYEIAEMWQYLKDCSDSELRRIKKDPKEKQVAKWMATAILNGKAKGDLTELHRMYDRIVGKKPPGIERAADGSLPVSGFIILGKELNDV